MSSALANLTVQNLKRLNLKETKSSLTALALEKLWQKSPDTFYHLSHDVLFSARPMALKERWRQKMQTATRELLLVPETGGHVATYRFGEGPAIILVHGWAARGMQLSEFIDPLVESSHSVIVYDQPAHGESSLRASNIFQFIYSLKRVIEASRDVVGLIGHSMGCSAIGANLKWFPWIEKVTMLAPHADLRSDMMGWITRRGLTPEMVESLIAWLEVRYELSFADINLHQVGTHISSEVLLIHDEDDDATLFENSLKLKEIIAAAEVYTTQGLGHFRMVRDPRIKERVTQWHTTRP